MSLLLALEVPMATRPNLRLPPVRAGIYTGVSADDLRAGRPPLAIAGSGGVADQLPEHAVAPPPWSTPPGATEFRRERRGPLVLG